MENCWQILILDPHTATERDVKSAYARLLKQNRPDVDPEGFQRVRQAYEAALGELRDWSDEGPTPVAAQVTLAGDRTGGHDAAPHSPFPEEVSGESPAALQEQGVMSAGAMEGLARRIQASWFPWTRHRLFRKAMEAMDGARLDGPARSRLWLEVFGADEEALAKYVPDFVLIALLKLHDNTLAAAMIGIWAALRKWGRIAQFGRKLDRHSKQLSPEHGHLVAHVAGLLALDHPRTAEGLANASFVMLGQHERRAAISHVESMLAQGQILKLLPLRLRRYWMRIVKEESTLENSWWSRRRLRRTARAMPDSWSGWQILHTHLSDPLWDFAQRCVKREGWWSRRLVIFRMFRARYWVWYLLPFMGVSLLVLYADNRPPPPRRPALSYADVPVTAADIRSLRAKKASRLAGLMPPDLDHSVRIWRSDFGIAVPALGSLAHDACAISTFTTP